jgi:hypothetical protein
MTFTVQTADGRTISYRDGKRYFWFFSFLLAFVAPATIGLYFWTGSAFAVLFPVLYLYAFIPLFDLIAGEDTHNPPEEVVEAMAADPYYRILLHAAVPIFWLSFLAAAWFVGTQDLPWWAIAVFALGAGSVHGGVLTIGHELGHKTNATDRLGAKLINAIIGYGHFCIEHNRGHHVWVSTPEDPASSRMGESIYQFARRELPGTFKRGWEHERLRLTKKGKSVWSVENDILQGYAITLAVAVVWVDAGELCRALWPLAPEVAERALRGGAAAPFVEHEPHRVEPALVPPAAPFGPSRERAQAVPGAAQLPRPAAPAERLSGVLRARRNPAALVRRHGPEGDGLGRRRHHEGQRRAVAEGETLSPVRQARAACCSLKDHPSVEPGQCAGEAHG